MAGRIIIVDGVSNAGKTTFVNSLKTKNITVIEEAPDFVENNPELFNNKKVPPYPETIEEEKQNQVFFLKAELIRLKKAKELIKNGKDVVLDRGFFGTAAMAYALSGEKDKHGINAHCSNLMEKYLEEVEKLKQCGIEIRCIFLIANTDIVNKRNVTRSNVLASEWINEKFIEAQLKYFANLASRLGSTIVDTSNLKKEEVARTILEMLPKRKKEVKR